MLEHEGQADKMRTRGAPRPPNQRGLGAGLVQHVVFCARADGIWARVRAFHVAEQSARAASKIDAALAMARAIAHHASFFAVGQKFSAEASPLDLPREIGADINKSSASAGGAPFAARAGAKVPRGHFQL